MFNFLRFIARHIMKKNNTKKSWNIIYQEKIFHHQSPLASQWFLSFSLVWHIPKAQTLEQSHRWTWNVEMVKSFDYWHNVHGWFIILNKKHCRIIPCKRQHLVPFLFHIMHNYKSKCQKIPYYSFNIFILLLHQMYIRIIFY